jgi:hypothetical protein
LVSLLKLEAMVERSSSASRPKLEATVVASGSPLELEEKEVMEEEKQ